MKDHRQAQGLRQCVNGLVQIHVRGGVGRFHAHLRHQDVLGLLSLNVMALIDDNAGDPRGEISFVFELVPGRPGFQDSFLERVVAVFLIAQNGPGDAKQGLAFFIHKRNKGLLVNQILPPPLPFVRFTPAPAVMHYTH
ncbi:MAG: hypothetical protein BWY09_02267 [Candidatus Hydrogenedentes bacterium ADurb.Bin179]|nr:MAG: hypothetical protein BWY09_02267 [Candidatus Hydrogenedentes bacterium ADurb.Bin179]